MKVVIDCRYVRPSPSGIGAYVSALASRLPKLAPEDHFEFWVNPRAPELIPSGPNVTKRNVSGDPLGPGTFFWPSRLAPLDDADVFHCPQNVLGIGVPCPTVVTVHDTMWISTPSLVEGNPLLRALQWPFLAGMARHALNHATRIISVSRATYDSIHSICPAATPRVRIAPNGVESVFSPPQDLRTLRERAAKLLGASEPFFLMLGTNQPYKGQEYAVRAFARASLGSTRLVLVQRRGGRRGLGRLATTLGIDNRVLFMNTLDRHEVITLMQSALALIHPSVAEGFGLPTLEAAACGTPVIASDIPPLVEVLGGAGLHFASGSVEDLARVMGELHASPTLVEELRQKGLERAKAFSWDTTAQITVDVYREAAKRGPT